MPHRDPDENRRYWREHRKKKLENGDSAFIEMGRARGRRAAKGRRDRIRALIRSAKDKPCIDCAVKYPVEIMDLDHVRGVKEFNLSKVINSGMGYVSITRIEAELDKCDARCPNCHRLRHFKNGDYENLRRARTKRSAAA